MTHNQVTFQLGKKENAIAEERLKVERQNAETRQYEAEHNVLNKERELSEMEEVDDYNKRMNRRQQDTAVVTTVVTAVATVVVACLLFW